MRERETGRFIFRLWFDWVVYLIPLQLSLHSHGGASVLEVRGGHVGLGTFIWHSGCCSATLAWPTCLREGPPSNRIHLECWRSPEDTAAGLWTVTSFGPLEELSAVSVKFTLSSAVGPVGSMITDTKDSDPHTLPIEKCFYSLCSSLPVSCCCRSEILLTCWKV